MSLTMRRVQIRMQRSSFERERREQTFWLNLAFAFVIAGLLLFAGVVSTLLGWWG